ncbi:polypyrimidine tract-binding protein homolog 1 isoform X1 [Rosa rugosa]|uniref:polypyrimidine tract-binding protein homolog 1 isoform X1 n=1 Tax=Rosa rugosa TaxID=74645 RepID=UPI002B400EF9|nr:polypyrimidine tract-binding protein homolog 1 isoform X1 [Rosa rugosa]
MSTSGTPQFRYTQTPSKVLHLRNLPWECAEEELIELCKHFGKIVNTKCNVGANRNQAFVEFADLNQAINMVSYYASSSEPAQVRGKTVYIQYSNRHEIVNNKSPGDVPGNVLLVTIEGVEAGDVSIDVIHLVFSAFGFVHKIATFEKAAGFQALIQFSDADTASAARNALDGRSIPRYLLPEHVGSCHLRISYSAHTDLNIKFQSHRSRDYTNPYLPVNPTAIEGVVQPAVGPDGKKKEMESNVLLASIENMQYAVTVDVLHTVFSAFGTVQKIAIFEKNGQTQALVQYPDIATAAVAREALEGHCIYDGGYCKLHLSYSRHTDLNVKAYSDKSRDYTIPDASLLAVQSGYPAAPAAWQNAQAAPVYHGNEYSAAAAGPGQGPPGQVPSWDPNMQAGRSSFVSVPSTFPGQTFPTSSGGPVYSSAPMPAGSSPPITSGVDPRGMHQPGAPSHVRPGAASPPGVRPPGASPSYYGQS